eukprot:361801-Chlamydomonas_euryale.AAC.1
MCGRLPQGLVCRGARVKLSSTRLPRHTPWSEGCRQAAPTAIDENVHLASHCRTVCLPHMQTHVYVRVCAHTDKHMRTYACVRKCACTRTCTHVHTRPHKRTCVHA